MMGLQTGLSARETMFLCPGELYDIYELYKESHGLKDRQDDDWEEDEE